MTLAELRADLMRDALDDLTNRRRETRDERVASNFLWDALPMYRDLKPDLTVETRGRKLWDVALESLRHLALDGPRSHFVRLLAGGLGCDELVTRAQVLLERSLELSRVGLQMQRAELKYDAAMERCAGPNSSAAKVPSVLAKLYASLKAFPEDARVDVYVKQASQYERLKLELLVEGPIQLAVSLSDDGLLAILRLPLWMGGIDEPRLGDLATVVRACRSKLQEQWEGGWLKAMVEIAHETVDLYADKLEDTLKAGRVFVPTLESRRRFIDAVESGAYRSANDV